MVECAIYSSLVELIYAGSGFKTFTLPDPIGNLSIGICMDLNPFTGGAWSYATGPFELASYCKETSSTKKRTRVLVVLCAWLDQMDDDASHNLHVLDYWMARLKPLWMENSGEAVGTNDEDQVSPSGNSAEDETIVIVCNRCGEENGEWGYCRLTFIC